MRFTDGFGDENQTATFTVKDTALPLPDRKYVVKLRVRAGRAVISQLGIASVTLVASNDPFGVFAFSPVSKFIVRPNECSNCKYTIEYQHVDSSMFGYCTGQSNLWDCNN